MVEVTPSAPYRCPYCMRYDSIPMPATNLVDKLARVARCAPFKCRACRAKFYRRPLPPTAIPPSAAVSAPAPDVAPCPRGRADTLRRLDNIIRNAEVRRLRGQQTAKGN